MSSAPAQVEDTAIPNAAPDWASVHFKVHCPRCDIDLHGRTEPICPQCALHFRWADVAPVEELTCAACGYHLYGLSEARCPECGAQFSWEEVLLAYRRRNVSLFEYRWGKECFRALLRAWWRAPRPGRFWRSVSLHDPPLIGPLLVLAVVALIVVWIGTGVITGVARALGDQSRFGQPFSKLVLREVHRGAFGAERGLLVLVWSAWMTAHALALLLYDQSLRRFKIRRGHMLRLAVYSMPMILPTMFIGWSLLIGAAYILDSPSFWWWQSDFTLPILFTVALSGWSVRMAARHYLRLPHSAGIAIATQVIALICLLLALALLASPGFYAHWRFMRWVLAASHWVYPL